MVIKLLEAFRVSDRLIGWYHKFLYPCNFGILSFIHKLNTVNTSMHQL